MLSGGLILRDFTIIYRVEKIVLRQLIFLLSRLVSVYWFQTQSINFIATANTRLLYGKEMWNKIVFRTNYTY